VAKLMYASDLNVVVIAYNRPVLLRALLNQLGEIDLNALLDISISLDGQCNPECLELAREFCNKRNRGEVITHAKRLGLRRHVMECGDYAAAKGDFVMFEDDLNLSPGVIKYFENTSQIFRTVDNVRQISSFSIHWNEYERTPFMPVCNGLPYFYAALGSSWGQYWTVDWWQEFSEWMSENSKMDFDSIDLHEYVKSWGDKSWKKYFNAFLLLNNYKVVYPVDQYSSHNAIGGTHSNVPTGSFKPLAYESEINIGLSDSSCIVTYDHNLRLLVPERYSNEFCIGNALRAKDLLASFKGRDLALELFRRTGLRLWK